MSGDQRPLIPVNPKGLEEIAAALLAQFTPSLVSPDGASSELPEIVRRNPRNYIWVPEKNIAIAKRQAYNNLNWEGSIRATAADKLCLPRIDEMMQYFLNARDAANGKKKLQDLAGNTLGRDETIELWNYLSSKDRSPFGNKPFWTWLNAQFKDGPRGIEMLTDYTITNNALVSNSRVTLDSYAVGDKGWTELSPLSKEGLPKKASTSADYMQGQNLYFWRPVNGKVARFVADSDWTILNCDGGPANVDPLLGVLACAAGGAPKK